MAKNSKLTKAQIAEIFNILQQNNPNPVIELNYTNHYTLLVAVVLSAQATDKGVNKATQQLFNTVFSPLDMVNLGEEELINHIKTIGLYKAKAKNVMALSHTLLQSLQTKYGVQTSYTTVQTNSVVPNTLQQLTALAGVGRKTANVILNQVFGLPTIAVDTHVYRVSKRLGLSSANSVEAVEQDLLKVIPKQYLKNAHHLLILFGRYHCKAKNYNCSACIVNNLCKFNNKVFK